MQQLTLLLNIVDIQTESSPLAQDSFSHENVCDETARLQLEDRYVHLLQETDLFNRQIISFQANKTETLHS
ncbi:MAG: hypothetical protein GY796_04160 [Chloroflexi bacterium]|nr:hypothetical protein [Chloroflexota bacterium]